MNLQLQRQNATPMGQGIFNNPQMPQQQQSIFGGGGMVQQPTAQPSIFGGGGNILGNQAPGMQQQQQQPQQQQPLFGQVQGPTFGIGGQTGGVAPLFQQPNQAQPLNFLQQPNQQQQQLQQQQQNQQQQKVLAKAPNTHFEKQWYLMFDIKPTARDTKGVQQYSYKDLPQMVNPLAKQSFNLPFDHGLRNERVSNLVDALKRFFPDVPAQTNLVAGNLGKPQGPTQTNQQLADIILRINRLDRTIRQGYISDEENSTEHKARLEEFLLEQRQIVGVPQQTFGLNINLMGNQQQQQNQMIVQTYQTDKIKKIFYENLFKDDPNTKRSPDISIRCLRKEIDKSVTGSDSEYNVQAIIEHLDKRAQQKKEEAATTFELKGIVHQLRAEVVEIHDAVEDIRFYHREQAQRMPIREVPTLFERQVCERLTLRVRFLCEKLAEFQRVYSIEPRALTCAEQAQLQYLVVSQLIRYLEALAVSHLDFEDRLVAVKHRFFDLMERRGYGIGGIGIGGGNTSVFESDFQAKCDELAGHSKALLNTLNRVQQKIIEKMSARSNQQRLRRQ